VQISVQETVRTNTDTIQDDLAQWFNLHLTWICGLRWHLWTK